MTTSGAVAGEARSQRNVVLVHGGFVDGSGWQGVHDILTRDDYKVSVVQNPTLSLEGDVAATRWVIDAQDGPVVLVGHSYGGAVITEAGTHPSVAALAHMAAGLVLGEYIGCCSLVHVTSCSFWSRSRLVPGLVTALPQGQFGGRQRAGRRAASAVGPALRLRPHEGGPGGHDGQRDDGAEHAAILGCARDRWRRGCRHLAQGSHHADRASHAGQARAQRTNPCPAAGHD